jgi:dTDP-4-amino-4,6-dideoxygalactose transaminase
MHVENRSDFVKAMADRGIETGIVHRRNDIFKIFGGRCYDMPDLDLWEKTAICLPIHNMMMEEDVNIVAESVWRGW